MKNILIITLGILAFFFLTTHGNSQTLTSDTVDFLWAYCEGLALGGYSLNYTQILSVTMPIAREPKWTINLKNGEIIVTNFPVALRYRPK